MTPRQALSRELNGARVCGLIEAHGRVWVIRTILTNPPLSGADTGYLAGAYHGVYQINI